MPARNLCRFMRRDACESHHSVERARMLCEMHVHGEAPLERRRLCATEEASRAWPGVERAGARRGHDRTAARLQHIAYGRRGDRACWFHDKVLLRALFMRLTKRPIGSKTKNFCLKIQSNFIELPKQSPVWAARPWHGDILQEAILPARQDDYGGIAGRMAVCNVTPATAAGAVKGAQGLPLAGRARWAGR